MTNSRESLRQLDRHGNSPIRVYLNNEADDYPAHWHPQYEFIMPVQERYEVLVDGVSHDVRPGEVLLIPSGVVHEIFAPPLGERYILMVDQEVAGSVEGLADLRHFFYPCVHLQLQEEGNILEQVRQLIWQAVREGESGQPLADAAVVSWIRLCLIRLSRWLAQRDEGERKEHRQRMDEKLLDVYAYITQHCAERLTLGDVAAYAGYSKYYFARIFKEHYGVSFYEFFLQQRMLLCRQLLGDENLSVTEVALRAGFDSIATFNRVFRQHEGRSPTAYRKMRRGGGDGKQASIGQAAGKEGEEEA